MSCQDTYNKTKNRSGGPIINVTKIWDTSGISSAVGLPVEEPKTGEMAVFLPIRYKVNNDRTGVVNGVTSIMRVHQNGTKYTITIQKTAITTRSVNSDAPTQTWAPVSPPVL